MRSRDKAKQSLLHYAVRSGNDAWKYRISEFFFEAEKLDCILLSQIMNVVVVLYVS